MRLGSGAGRGGGGSAFFAGLQSSDFQLPSALSLSTARSRNSSSAPSGRAGVRSLAARLSWPNKRTACVCSTQTCAQFVRAGGGRPPCAVRTQRAPRMANARPLRELFGSLRTPKKRVSHRQASELRKHSNNNNEESSAPQIKSCNLQIAPFGKPAHGLLLLLRLLLSLSSSALMHLVEWKRRRWRRTNCAPRPVAAAATCARPRGLAGP